ncbi:MAG: restriction endonuclease subunit S [Oscillibacter sp.]|nr:restriction endonuclease subunit S [Oscillibacter sp.]
MVTYPNDWTESKLLDHVNLVQGLTYSPESVRTHGTLVLRSSNIQQGHLALEDNVYVNSSVPREKMILPGDILVCVRNGSPDLIGKSCVLPAMGNTTFGAFMSVLRGDSTGYIAKIFESNIVQEQFKNRSNTTINQITKEDFKSVALTMPDVPEQKVIAGVLSSFDSYIANLGELIEKKKAVRDGVLEDLISGRTRLCGFSDKWKRVRIGQILKILHGKNQREVESPNGHFPIMGTGGIIGKATKFLCDWECVLIGRKGTIDQPYYMNTPFWTIDTLYYSRPAGNQCVKFQYYLFCSINWFDFTESSGRPSLTRKAIEAIEIKIPKYEEQKAIADVLTAMDDEIKSLTDERDKMIQIREGAMDDLLTGRVRLAVE